MSIDAKLSFRKLEPGSGDGMSTTELATASLLKLAPPSVDLTNIWAFTLAPSTTAPLSKKTETSPLGAVRMAGPWRPPIEWLLWAGGTCMAGEKVAPRSGERETLLGSALPG